MPEPYASRRTRLLQAASKEGLEALVCYSSGVHSFIEMDPVWYTTGFKPLGACGLLVAPDLEPVLYVQPSWDLPRAAKDCDVEVRFDAELFAALGKALAAVGTPAGATGVCGVEKMSRPDVEQLSAAIGTSWRDFDEGARQVGLIKDDEERELIARATWIAEEGWRHALEGLRPGMREHELAARLDVLMRELGADDNFLLVSASQHNLSVHAPGDRILLEGDILLAEISPSYRGAFAQICRTAVIGEPSATLVDHYALLRDAYQQGLRAARPSATMGEVVEAVNGPIAAAGFEEFCRPPYMRTRGHGMGIGSPFPISVAADSPIVLEAGMAFVLHPNQYLPSTGYLLCGDHVAIDDSGAKALSGRLAQLDTVGV
jgi:Xaa-Pro dipeptidase